MNFIDETAKIGEECIFGNNIVILKNVEINKNVKIGNNVVIYSNTKIGDGVEIQDNSVIGKLPRMSIISSARTTNLSLPTIIGDETFIGALCTIYASTQIGKKCFVGDLASIREGCFIDDFTIIGRSVTVECNTKIGKNVKIQTACHITGDMVIEDNVFFGPEVTTMNDKYMGALKEPFKGPHVKRNAKIGGNATLLPGITIGENSVVGAGSVVTHDVPPYKVVIGVPARVIKDVLKGEIINKGQRNFLPRGA